MAKSSKYEKPLDSIHKRRYSYIDYVAVISEGYKPNQSWEIIAERDYWRVYRLGLINKKYPVECLFIKESTLNEPQIIEIAERKGIQAKPNSEIPHKVVYGYLNHKGKIFRMDMITFEGIRRIYEEEKRKPNMLSALPSSFFSEVGQYLANLSDSSEEFEKAKRRLESIFEMRERKIVNSALDFVRADILPQNMMSEEKSLMDSVISDIESFRGKMAQILKSEAQIKKEGKDMAVNSGEVHSEDKKPLKEANREEKKDTNLLLVDFVSDVHKFMGTDLKSHGPFKKGDMASIPAQNAKVIERKGIGVIIQGL